jgi:hypothetical protein
MSDASAEVSAAFAAFGDKLTVCLDQVANTITRPDFNARGYMQYHAVSVVRRVQDRVEEEGVRGTMRYGICSRFMEDTLGEPSRRLGRIIIDKLGDTEFTVRDASGWVMNDILMLSRGLIEDPEMFAGEAAASVEEEEAAAP